MKIAIYGRTFNPEFKHYILELFEILNQRAVEVLIHENFHQYILEVANYIPGNINVFKDVDDAPHNIDFMISIGGDGTFLESLSYLKDFNIPVVGLNSGRLGFLANISKEEISKAIEAMCNGKYNLEKRSVLELDTNNEVFNKHNFALNEVTVQKKDSTMITIETFLNNEYLNTYWTDGLIISTPTGATAYNLSVGGPLVLPGSSNIIIAPIAPHNLTVRPLIVPDSFEIKLVVKSRSNSFLVTADNRTASLDSSQNEISIRKARYTLTMLNFPFNNYYSTLRNKLMWGADKRN